jgi:hypothetical protein
MPALPAVSKVVRVDHHFTEAQDPNVMVHSFFQYTGTCSSTDAATWLTNIVSALGTFMASASQPTLSLVLSELTDLSSTSAAQVQNSTGHTGGAGAAPLAAGVAMVMKYRINRRYRGGHPRVYLPGMSNTYLTTPTQWNSTSLGSITGLWIAFINACIANTNPAALGTLTHVNVSYFAGHTWTEDSRGNWHRVPTPRGTPVVDQIINIQGNPTPGSQRRRNEQP